MLWKSTAYLRFFLIGIFVSQWSQTVRGQNALICPKGKFACNNTMSCVEQKQNCDGHKDCSDGSDEWNCENMQDYKFWNDLFKKRPDEDSDKFTGSCDLDNPPVECFCAERKLICDHRHFVTVPKDLPIETTYLVLSGNDIKNIIPTDFQNMSNLETLLLSYCLIEKIENRSFEALHQLKSLHLEGNLIKEIEENVFHQNKLLQHLTLGYNKLEVLHKGSFSGLENLETLDLQSNHLKFLASGVFESLKKLNVLWLNENELTSIDVGVFNHLISLTSLYITKNKIKNIEPLAFSGMDRLQGLYLRWNRLEQLYNGAFDNLTNLQNLDLEANELLYFEAGLFRPLSCLESLNLRKNPFEQLESDLLQDLKRLTHIYFDEFRMCAFAWHVRVCEPKSDGISSLENLLDNLVLRGAAWIVAILACLGNAFVLISRLLIKETNEVHSFYIKNLSLADFFMGVYLVVIASYDMHFRGTYIRHDRQWRHSWQCNFCGFLSTLSSEASVFTLVVITFDRYFSISRPLSLQRRTKRLAAALMLFLWLAAALLSALPLLPIDYYGSEFYGNNGVCVPLHIHQPFAQAWEYSATIFIGANFVAFAFIFYAYLKMFLIIKDSTMALRSTQEKQDCTIAKRFAFIVGTDFLCWMPVIFVKVMALGGK